MAPLATNTRGLFGPEALARVRDDAWLINLARGAIVDEPLPAHSPLWSLPNVIVSPHMSADFHGWEGAVTSLFLDQLGRFRTGGQLINVVDKELGFVPGR